MATYYGRQTGDWNVATTWTLDPVGAGGAAASTPPGSADDVVLDAGAGAITITLRGINLNTNQCRHLDMTGFTGTLHNVGSGGSVGLTLYGNWTWPAGTGSLSVSGSVSNRFITAAGNGAVQTINVPGRAVEYYWQAGSFGSAVVGNFTLGANLDTGATGRMEVGQASSSINLAGFNLTGGEVRIERGTFNTNNGNITCTSFNTNFGNTRSITLGTSTITVTSNSGATFNPNGLTTYSGANTTWIFAPATTTGTMNIGLGGQTNGTIRVQAKAPTWDLFDTGSCTNLELLQPSDGAANTHVTFRGAFAGTGVTCTNFTAQGASRSNRLNVLSNSFSVARTVTVSGSSSLRDVTFRDITASGAGWAAPTEATRVGDATGNSGFAAGTFQASRTLYSAGGVSERNSNDQAAWALTSGTSVAGTEGPPLPQDDIVCTGNTKIKQNMVHACRNLTVTGGGTAGYELRVTNADTFHYGSVDIQNATVVGNGGSTFFTLAGRGSHTLNFGTTGSLAGLNVDLVRFSAVGGTYSLQSAMTTPVLQHNIGTFLSNNHTINCTQLSSVNAETRTLNLGTSTVNCSGTGTIVSLSSNAQFTFPAQAPVFVSTNTTSTARTIELGGRTIGGVTYTVPGGPLTLGSSIGERNYGALTLSGTDHQGGSKFVYILGNAGTLVHFTALNITASRTRPIFLLSTGATARLSLPGPVTLSGVAVGVNVINGSITTDLSGSGTNVTATGNHPYLGGGTTSSVTANSTSASISIPAGVVSGVVVLVAIASSGGSAFSIPGFTALVDRYQTGTSRFLTILKKTATGAESGNYTLTADVATQWGAVAFPVFKAAEPTTAATGVSAAGTTTSFPDYTPAGPERLLLRFVAGAGDRPPGNWLNSQQIVSLFTSGSSSSIGGSQNWFDAASKLASVTDSFDRADSTTSLGTTDTGQLWQALIGTWGISSNRAYLTAGEGVAAVPMLRADVEVSARLYTARDNGADLVARITSASTYFMLSVGSDNALRLRLNSNGTITNIASVAYTWTSGDKITLRIKGNTLTGLVNDAVVITGTSAAIAVGTLAGLRATGSAARWDDFSVTDITDSTGAVSETHTSAANAYNFATIEMAPVPTGTPVSASTSAQWDVQAVVADAVSSQWDAQSVVSDAVSAQWGAQTSVTDDLDTRWSIQTAVGDAVDTRWDARAGVADALDTRWDASTTVADSWTAQWDAQTSAARSTALQWDVNGVLVGAADTLELRWDSLVPVSDALSAQWAISTPLSKAAGLQWDQRALVSDGSSVLWAARVALAEELALPWDALASFTAGHTVVWSVQTSVADELGLSWNAEPSSSFGKVRVMVDGVWTACPVRVFDPELGQWRLATVRLFDGVEWRAVR